MGIKTRSNYAPSYKLTQEEFNRIFSKGESSESKIEEKTEHRGSNRTMENQTESNIAKETE